MLPSWSNTAFIPVSKNTNEEFLNGIYNYVNSAKDESCAAEAKRIFGDNLIDPSNQNAAGLQIGAASIARAGFDGDPVGFFKAQGWEIPTGYTSSLELTRQAGLRIMQQSSSIYAENQKAIEQFRKDQRETLNAMPEMLTESLYRAGAIGSDALLKTDAKMKPEDLERISKYYDKEEAVQSYRRARNAWAAFSYFMRDVDSLQSVNREQLTKIADFLKDKDGSPDLMATATLALLVDRRAKDMQTDNPEAWQLFVDHLQNWGARGEDQQLKDKALEWNKLNAELVKTDPIAAKWEDKRYGNETVENLYAMLQGALNTSMSPSEKASWYEHAMADVSRIAGESVVPTLAGIASAWLLKGAGASAFTAGAGSYLTNYSLNANSTINAAVADAYRTGKINPEAYGRIEGQAQAAVEGIVDMGTTYKGFQYLAGKGANKIASLSSGSRFLTNKYARTVISYLGAGALEGAGELFEEELGGALSASLNTLARSTGVEMSANQYSFGEALGDMQSHEIAAVFAYTYALGLFGIPADYKRAKVFASNTDNLRAAGLSTSGVRRVQEAFLDTELKIAAINQNNSLSPEQKKEQIDKVEEDFGIVQKLVIQTDVWDASPEEVRQRLKKEGKKVLDKAELATILQHEIDLRLMRKAGIIGAEPSAPDTYTVTFIQEGEKKEDGTKGESKIITQEWSRNQLTNWLQIEKADLLEANLRKFQSLVKAHAAAQEITIDGLKIEFQNMRDIPLGAYESLQKHNALTEDFFAELSSIARNMIIDLQNNGMTAQEAAQQPSGIFKGVSLGEAAALDTAAAGRKEQASQTSEGESKGITADTSVSFPAMNIRRADGSYLIAYVAGDTNINDMLEDMLETHIKHQLTTGQITRNQLAGFLKEVDSHLPGKSILPKNKTDYSMSDLVEAYSSLAMAHYLYNEQYLPLTQGGHQLMRNIGRVVDTARTLKTLGDSWFTYANSEEGKAYLADSGKDLMSIMQEAGFTFGNILAQARATAQHEQDVREALNYQPDIEQEVKALMDSAQQEQQLADLNQQEAKEPITIPADQSITGKEITIEPEPRSFGEASLGVERPETGSDEAGTIPEPDPAADLTGTKATTILSHMRDLIDKGKARAEHFAIVFREIPGLTEAQAIEQGIRPLTQRGEPSAAYTQGKRLAERCTDVQYQLLKSGKLPQKAKRDILGAPTQTRKNPAWPKIAKKGIAPAEQRLTIIKSLQNAVDYASENPNYNLNYTRHIISKGREYYIATDGRRLAVIERTAPKGSKNIEESLDKNGNVVKDAKFPEFWRQVMITLTDKAQTLDLAPFRYLETYPKTAINHVVWQDSEGKLSKYNPNYIGKGIKFFSTLSKAIGSPSIIQVDNQNMGPILMQSDHDGWTAKYLLMPMRLVDGDIYKEGDILLNPQTDSPANFSIKAVNTEAQTALTFESTPDAKAEKVKQDLERLKNTELHCINAPDIVATVKARQRGKLVSPAALNKSIANGFTMSQHLAAANKIDKLYKFAIPLGEYDDMNHEANVKAIFRFACPVRVDSKIAFALLTLKRTEGDKLYSLELDEINQLGGTLDRLKHLLKEEPSTIPLRAADDVVARFLSKVKEYFGENALPPVSATESADLFTNGVLETQNAIITQPDANFSIKALHASPHNFRKFTTEKMGTGEGAQAYGWGLYFAENKEVNREYYKNFASEYYQERLFQGDTEMDEVSLKALVHDVFMRHGGDALVEDSEEAIVYSILREGAKKQVTDYENFLEEGGDDIPGLMAALRELEGLDLERKRLKMPVTNYRVELNADDTNLLMWDKRYSGQEIKDLLGEELFEQVYDEGDEDAEMLDNGEGVYMLLRSVARGAKEASELLLKHGVKGIKYLDYGSRGDGKGTYNYVIFSGDDIKITAVNESGIWSMDEGWEEYTDPTATFSIRAANPSTLDRFTVDPLGERIVHTVRTEARRYARVLGDKTPQEQAMNAIASAESIINAVDKYLHRPDKPISRRHRNQLTKLRSIIEKYAQIIASGTPRSFKRISPAEQQELQAAIAELEAAELDTAETDPALLIEDSDRTTKRTRDARAAELRRRIIREAAKGRVYKVLAAMLDTAADALDDYLKDQLLTKLHRLTATVAIKRTTGKRLKGKMTAPLYRELEQAIQIMAYSARQKEDAIDTILTAHETLAQAIASNEDNLTRGNALLIELAHQLEQDGTPVTAKTLTAALAAHEARVAIFADITSKNYEQTRTAANAIYHIIRYGRALWQQKHEAREAFIQQYLRYFLAHTTPESETANAKRNKNESRKWKDALSLDITMNAAQTIMALSSYEALRPLMQDLLANYSTAAVARQKHLQEIRKQELYAFGRIIGITPATQAGYTDKQLKELSDKFDAFYAENNKTVETTITPTRLVRNAAGELEPSTSAPLKLTKWEALNLILTYRQEHYQPNAQEHGFTPEILTQLENFIGQQMMDYGNAIQQILVNDGTIPVYEEREGIPMRDNPLYWPGHININTINTTRDEPLVNPYHPAASHDFLHARVRNRQEVGNRNAFGVFRKAIADRANYVYADPVTDTITSLLARDQFANRLETLIGGSLKRQLQTLINEIKGAAWQETSLQDATSGLISAAFGAKSLAVLSGNPSSLIRQFSAVANAGLMPGISPQKYLAYAIKAKQNQSHISFTDILKLDAFTTRKRDNAYVNEMIAMGADATFSTLMNWAKAGMNAMDKLDLLANAFSATVIYNIKYDQLKAQGILSEEQIRKRCEQEVAIYTKLLAQPLNRVDKSALYWMIGHEAIGRAILFMGSEAINKVGMLRANYIMYRNQGNNPAFAAGKILVKMGFTVGLASAITEAALALLLGRTPDDDDSQLAFYIALWLNASFGQYLSTIPLLGGVTDIVFSPYGGYSGDETVLPGTQLFTRDIGKLHTMLTDDKEYSVQQWNKEINRFMRNFTTILGYAGGANSKWQIYSSFAAFCQSLTAALNAEGFIFNVAANLTGTADEKTRRPKSKIEKWLTPEAYRGEQKRAKRTRKTDKKATTRTKTTKTRERKSE